MTILEMSLSTSALIVVIVIIRALTLHRLPKKTFLALWGIVICRLLIPFSIPSQFSVYTLVDRIGNGTKELSDTTFPNSGTFSTLITNMGIVGNVETASQATSPAVSLPPIILVWIAGFIACSLFFVITHLRCRREYKTALPIQIDLVDKWKQEHPTKRPVQIRQSDKIVAPLTYGIWKPVILLPKTIDYKDERRWQYILAHEYTHIKRFDLLSKWLLATALCVHWFNPLVWVMYTLSNRDIELYCDETVVRTFGETIKSAYALALIGLEEKKSRFAPLCNNFSKNSIEERITAIMKIKKTSLVGIVLALTLVLGTATVFATSAFAGSSNNNTTNSNIDTVTTDTISANTTEIDKKIKELDDYMEECFDKIMALDSNDSKYDEKINNLNKEIDKASAQQVELLNQASELQVKENSKQYEKFGLEYDEKTQRYTVKGKLVRYFEDNKSTTQNTFLGNMLNYEDGDVDVIIKRDSNGVIEDLEVLNVNDTKDYIKDLYENQNSKDSRNERSAE